MAAFRRRLRETSALTACTGHAIARRASLGRPPRSKDGANGVAEKLEAFVVRASAAASLASSTRYRKSVSNAAPDGHYLRQSRRSLKTSSVSSLHVIAEEPSSWRLFPAKGEVFMENVVVGSHNFSFETGKLARFASGAVVVGIKDTKVLTTVVSDSKSDENKGFLPLQVDYREKQYAQGKIPNTFMRREGAPKERELLVGRMIDRSVRPLFPKGFFYETQIMGNVLCIDGEQDPDILCANAASAALTISDIPWNGPVGVVRVGRINGRFIVNPGMDELSESDLNLVYACTNDKTIMIETQAREISNKDLKAAFRLAHEQAKKLIPPQLRLASKVKNEKRQFTFVSLSTDLLEKIREIAEVPINSIMEDPSYGKFERGKALSKVERDVANILKDQIDEASLKAFPLAFDEIRKQVVRRNIFENRARVDGRQMTDVRDIYCQAGVFTPLHGSSLFSRGNTQVLCTVTLGALEDAQRLDSLVGPPSKHFMVHYSFPPYCTNEVGKPFGLNRREIGHGTLAEKALLALLPPDDEFPYSVRVTSEVMASDGSSSMATVCGGCLALMDAGVPLSEHVAGVSIGLVTKADKLTGKITDYRILTDILGLEDHVGDMDFKIAGTRKGVTAIQLDIKPAGIPLHIICESLEPALTARVHILKFMEAEIKVPRDEQKSNVPRTGTLAVHRDSIARLIGPQGATVKNIQRTTGARLFVSDSGTVNIFAKDQTSYNQARDMVETTIGKEIEVGNTYNGVVIAIKDFGAFVELDGGHQGLLHISEISHEKTSRVADAVTMGQRIKVMCIGRDVRGNLKLSVKAISSMPSMGPDSAVSSVSISVESDQIIEDQAGKISPVEAAGSFENVLNQNIPKLTTVISRQQTVHSRQENATFVERLKAKRTTQDRKTIEGHDTKDIESQLGYTALEDGKKDALIGIKGYKPYVGTECSASVLQTRKLGAVLQMSNGICGKLFYTKEQGPSMFQVGEHVHVRCVSIDKKGHPVFVLLPSEARQT